MKWFRFHPHGYEVSSQGDTLYSALFARLADGRTIEEAYQLDVKGYRQVSADWRVGKGGPPLLNKTRAELWAEYLQLWRLWSTENPGKIEELCAKANKNILTDKFAKSEINQAHALAVLCSELQKINQLGGLVF